MKKILCFIYEGCADFEITVVCTDINMSEKFELIPIMNHELIKKPSAIYNGNSPIV